MMSKFVSSGIDFGKSFAMDRSCSTVRLLTQLCCVAGPSQRAQHAPGEREANRSNWAKRFARKSKVALKKHEHLLWHKRVLDEAKDSEYLLEKPLFADQPQA